MEPAFAYPLPRLPYLKLRFELETEEIARLPEFKGSLLRGAFGSALRRTVCVMGHQQACADCFLNRQCVNTHIFETLIFEPPPRFLRGLPTAPKPFILHCPDEQQEFTSEESLKFYLTLIGTACTHFPFVIFAVHEMARGGLAARRYRFHLNRVCSLTAENKETLIYDGTTQKLIRNPEALVTADGFANLSCESLQLRFLTPVRMKFNRTLGMEFSFRQLVFKMLRRVLELAYFYVPDAEINWEFHDLLVAADDVQIVEKNLRWIELTRYSNRQKTKMQLGGFVGHITLKGNLTPFLPLLHACQVLHIGKATTFGLGRVEVISKWQVASGKWQVASGRWQGASRNHSSSPERPEGCSGSLTGEFNAPNSTHRTGDIPT